jgi:uncharacterized membrane protein YjjP (DUF1212 family)
MHTAVVTAIARTTAPTDDLLEFLRRCGAALCLAGEAASRIPDEMEAIAEAYGIAHSEFLVVPTGVFVRFIDETDDVVIVDFMNADGPPFRLDQVDALYKLIQSVKRNPIPPDEAIERLKAIVRSKPRFVWPLRIIGYTVLTVGLGMLLVNDQNALLALAGLGFVVGILRLIADRVQVLSLALPVAAAMLVTGLAYRYGPQLGAEPSTLLIPPLVSFLPGAALTLGAQEMATRSMISGASRIVSGMYMLLLLTFGIVAGRAIANPEPLHIEPTILPPWVPVAGVLIFGIGMYFNSSAPKWALPWLLLMLYCAWGAQQAGAMVAGGGSGLFGAFTGGLVVVPIATLVQRLHGPPAQVASLPAFWLLVPGALGLAGVSNLVEGLSGSDTLVNAFLSVVSVALGILVGSSLAATARASSRLLTSRAERKRDR